MKRDIDRRPEHNGSVPSFYLGPRQQWLIADHWPDLEAAVQVGALGETQWCELKKAVPTSSPAANDELARDLASLTVDGGVLLVGVRDKASALTDLVGVLDEELSGLTDRIAAVARSRVTPPMHVAICAVPDPAGGRSVVVVEVPPSAVAPHMVQGIYWGRGAVGKQPLTDADVTRLMTERRGREERFVTELNALATSDFDPVALERRSRGRCYVRVQPATPPSVKLSEALAGTRMVNLLTSVGFRTVGYGDLGAMSYELPSTDGWYVSNYLADSWADAQDHYLDALLLESDGTISYVNGDVIRPAPNAPGEDCLSLGGMCEAITQCLQLGRHLAENYLQYAGSWRVGVYLERLRGLHASQAFTSTGGKSSYPALRASQYSRVATVAAEQMVADGSEAIEPLVGDLARGLGISRLFPYADLNEMKSRLQPRH